MSNHRKPLTELEHMNNQELIEFVEQHLLYKMFDGCEIDTHMGDKPDPAPWSVSFRADTISRLLDLAKAAHGTGKEPSK